MHLGFSEHGLLNESILLYLHEEFAEQKRGNDTNLSVKTDDKVLGDRRRTGHERRKARVST